MNEWQPIESAPKDGTRILLYRARALGGPNVQIGRWHEKRGFDSGRFIEKATHWMYLPGAPALTAA